MKIKLPFVYIETKEEYSCKNYNEYELKIKSMRTKLHSRYIAFIATGIVVWLIATGASSNENFPEWISFASTITSIILSVIAIIMSITGENKTESIRDKLEEATKKLERAAVEIDSANKENIKNIDGLKGGIEELNVRINSIPQKTIEKLNNEFDIQNSNTREINGLEIGWMKNEK